MELQLINQTITKADISNLVDETVKKIESGETSALAFRLQATALKKAIDEIDTKTREHQLREAQTYSAKSFEYRGAKIEVAETGTKYDFTVCGDPVWNELALEMERLKSKIKERETLLKTIKGSVNIITEDGEAVTIYAPHKTSTTGLKVTI